MKAYVGGCSSGHGGPMDAMECKTLTELLDLDGFEVVQAESDRRRKTRRLAVTSTTVVAACPHCGGATADRHECYDREVVDLPLGGWKTELIVRLFQFECKRCGKFFSPGHPALARGPHATRRFVERLAEWATHGDVSTAARVLGVAEKTAEEWYYNYLQAKVEEPRKDLKPIECLGIDELSLKKGTVNSAAC